ncbi:MAG: HYR domain-containing protein [Flavobacteriaceae bacterium]|nr:HYR domain-containing protein [Flavobacteriaceae bacterium]
MSGIPKLQNHPDDFSPFSPGKAGFWIVLTFLMVFVGWSVVGQNPETITPQYQWLNKEDIATVSLANLNTDDLIISIATDPQGNVYTLSFGKGVAKRDADGNMINAQFIPSGELDNPLDIAIDEVGFIYIADFLASGEFFDNGKIRIFDSNGNFLPNRTILTSFYRPLGLDVNDENVYVAEFNDAKQGPEQNQQLSRVRIYNKNNGVLVDQTKQVEVPFRIAVDSQKNVFVSQAGNNSPAVLIFDQNLNYQGELPNIISPGSVVVDSFDFIHVLEYTTRIDFSQFINFADIGPTEILAISDQINRGISNEDFVIKIYDVNRTLVKTFKEFIDFPVDLAFNRCDRMYVNNAEIFGTPIFGTFFPSKLEFDLEIYKRTPSFDKAEAPVITCPANIEVTTNAGNNYAVANFPNATATDNCAVIVTQTFGLPTGSQFPIGDSTIEFTAKDSFGNTDICTFLITVKPGEEVNMPPVFVNCPANILTNNDPGFCGAKVTFQTPIATDDNNIVTITRIGTGPQSGDLFPVGTNTLNFEANDGVNTPVSCSFTVTVLDNENPAITCPSDKTENIAYGQTGKIVTYNLPVFNDNCPGSTILQTDGLASGINFPLGTTNNTYVVTDASGNTAECGFTVTVIEDSDTEVPVITCPSAITINVDSGTCGAVTNYTTPTATDNSGTPTVRFKSGLASGSVFPVGITTVIYEAEDAAGNMAECSFTITVIDNEDPTITYPSDKTENVAYGQTGKIVTYNLPVFNDNCPGSKILQTDGLASGSNFPLGTTNNTFVVTDASGNTAECSFTITITEDFDTEYPVITCPAAITKNVDSGTCGAVSNYTTPTATDNSGTPTVRFKSGLASGSVFPVGVTTVIYEAEDAAGNKAECSFTITVIDNEDPTITCPSDKTENYDPAIGFTLPDYTSLGITADNCGFVNATQFPAIGTLVTRNTQIIITATDAADNSSTCNFMVNLSENEVLKIDCPLDQIGQLNENCQFTIPDYRSLATVNFQNAIITQSPLAGTVVNSDTTIILTANLNGKTDECYFQLILEDTIAPDANCVGEYSLSLNADGVANLSANEINSNSTDHCGIASIMIDKTLFTFNDLGENTVILTVTDTAGNVDSCTTIVRVLIGNYVPGDFNCKSPVVIQLDETGNATISSSDLYTGNPGDRNFVLSKTSFNCSNIGNNRVDFSFTGNDGSGTCGINVIVEDNLPPEVQTRNITVTLNSFGTASITAEMIDNGSSDNCGTPQLSLDVSTFSCNNLGENTVILTATDGSGNFTTQAASVTVSGSCKEIPVTGFEYIFIYPNPTPGPFTFDTPSGWILEKVEVYDARGRYVLTETYSENEFEYSMDLSSLQQAVYILKLHTSQGIRIIRVIIY